MRVESWEVWTLNHSSKSGHLCVAKSAVSQLEASSRHTEVRSEPCMVRSGIEERKWKWTLHVQKWDWREKVKVNLTLTIFPSDSTIVPESESLQNFPRLFLLRRKSSTQSLKVKTFFSWEPLPPVVGNQSDKDLPAQERHQQASSGPWGRLLKWIHYKA